MENFAASQLGIVVDRLSRLYGRPTWQSSGEPLDELISTILSQHTSDKNTERAYASLRASFPEWRDVLNAPVSRVVDAIRCGGLANVKAPRIQEILRLIDEQTGQLTLDFLNLLSVEDARRWLCSLPGVGPKTASCVLLFSLGLPTMPVDTHVYRVSRRLGLIDSELNANAAHARFDDLLGADRDLAYTLHLNLIRHGRVVCKARSPQCHSCILADICPGAQS